jgi:signal transduction histidine kinase
MSVGERSLRSRQGKPLHTIGGPDWFLGTTLDLVAAVVGSDASARIAVPDSMGRLRVVARIGVDGSGGRLRSARRREAFRSGRAIEVSPGQTPGQRLAIFPLIGEDEPLGVLEIMAPAAVLDARRERVSATVDGCASVLRELRDRAIAEPARPTFGDAMEISSALLRARTKVDALGATVAICWSHVRAPVAGVLPDRSGQGWFVAAVHGLGRRRAAQLRAALRALPSPAKSGRSVALLQEAFRSVVGHPCEAFEAGPAILLLAGHVADNRELLASAGQLLATALADDGPPPRTGGGLDIGIAWMAHELRTPVLAARSAIDHVLLGERNGEGRSLLLRARNELAYLADLAEPLLYWAAGSGELTRGWVDLVELVREVLASCVGDPRDERVTLHAPRLLAAWIDGGQLRGAIANIVRNALAYSPADSPVAVTIEAKGKWVRIYVRDRGPGIPPEERDAIFHPFARGQAGSRRRAGRGLGLFIANRIVEAHGGSIGIESSDRGTAFCLKVPL